VLCTCRWLAPVPLSRLPNNLLTHCASCRAHCGRTCGDLACTRSFLDLFSGITFRAFLFSDYISTACVLFSVRLSEAKDADRRTFDRCRNDLWSFGRGCPCQLLNECPGYEHRGRFRTRPLVVCCLSWRRALGASFALTWRSAVCLCRTL